MDNSAKMANPSSGLAAATGYNPPRIISARQVENGYIVEENKYPHRQWLAMDESDAAERVRKLLIEQADTAH